MVTVIVFSLGCFYGFTRFQLSSFHDLRVADCLFFRFVTSFHREDLKFCDSTTFNMIKVLKEESNISLQNILL